MANSSPSRGQGTFNFSTTCQSASKQGENLVNHMLQTPGRSQYLLNGCKFRLKLFQKRCRCLEKKIKDLVQLPLPNREDIGPAKAFSC